MGLPEDAWGEVARHLRALGSGLMARTDEPGGDERSSGSGPSDDEFKDAVRVVGERASTAFGSLVDRIREPEFRAEAEETASALLRAVGASLREVGSQVADSAGGIRTTDRGSGEEDLAPVDETEADPA